MQTQGILLMSHMYGPSARIRNGHWERMPQLTCLICTPGLCSVAFSSGREIACRYRKRGVNDAGRVANEVEIEQVVDAGFDWRTGFPLLASLVQVCPLVPVRVLECHRMICSSG